MESFVQKRPISSFASRDTALPYLAIYVLSGACQPLLMCEAGSSIFAVVYASVTIWAALLSRILLQRRLSRRQWLSIGSVFGGLALTGLDAKSLGPEVFMGSLMIATGTILHATCHTPFRS
eukprot:g73.t1